LLKKIRARKKIHIRGGEKHFSKKKVKKTLECTREKGGLGRKNKIDVGNQEGQKKENGPDEKRKRV